MIFALSLDCWILLRLHDKGERIEQNLEMPSPAQPRLKPGAISDSRPLRSPHQFWLLSAFELIGNIDTIDQFLAWKFPAER